MRREWDGTKRKALERWGSVCPSLRYVSFPGELTRWHHEPGGWQRAAAA